MIVLLTSEPEVPVIVTMSTPTTAEEERTSVMVENAQGFEVAQLELLAGVTELGENVAAMPTGRFVALSATAELKLSTPVTVIWVATVVPGNVHVGARLGSP
jgi:hypothetical protein